MLLLASGPAALAQVPDSTIKAPATPGKRRPGSVPTQPVRIISADPNEPQSPPPPGERSAQRTKQPGISRKAAPSLTPDSTGLAVRDTSRAGRRQDSLHLADLKRRSQIQTTVKYAASDSIQFDVTQKIARLYTQSVVDYGEMNMKADLITVDYGKNTVLANSRTDSVKHRLRGKPVFKQGSDNYTAEEIAYNFKSKRGIISGAITQQGEGYVHSELAKKQADNTIHNLGTTYTTCNLAHPHFYIRAAKAKVIPGKSVVTGPFHMVIGDVPLPLGLPFGYFPMQHGGRGSGVIIPTFGQAQDRGYYLTNGGYYWAPNDYLGLRVTGDLYAGNAERFGGYGINTELTYDKRYRYRGSARVSYTNRPTTSILSTGTAATNPEYVPPPTAQTFWISWNHSPVPAPGGGVFSASVQAGSSFYNRVNTLDPRRYLAAAFNSTISYSKQLRHLPINYSIQATQSQNVQTGVMDFTLPNLSVGVARQYPYQWLGIQPRGAWYEQFAVSYNLVAQNRISNIVEARQLASGIPLLGGSTSSYTIPVSLSNLGALLRNAQNAAQHQFQITLPSARLFRQIQVQPSINYGETWYAKSLNYEFVPEAQAVRIDTISGFNRQYSYSANVSATTTFYGQLNFKKGNVRAIRHKVTPSVSYAFSPDLTKGNAYQLLEVGADQRGNAINGALRDNYGRLLAPQTFTRYQGFLLSQSASARVSQVSFSVQNQIEMKVRNKQDTTGTQEFKKVSLADGIDLAVGYNFAATSFKLSDLSLGYRVQIAKKLNVVVSSSFSFYQRDSTGVLLDKYLFAQKNFRLARLSSANFSTGYQFNPAAKPQSKANVPRATAPANDPVLGSPTPVAIYADYVDFDIPWEASVQYTASYTTNASPFRNDAYAARNPFFSNNSLTASGSVKLTENLRLSSSLSFDLRAGSFVYPVINFTRDLHCWQITGMWMPVGITRGYSFTIAAKSSLLQDLKLNRNRTILNR
ncbi:MAG TPA: putative LPS assembly protein LptD [Hymenobacter sp.]|uniref:putative LPS assembly protein LptD n=1 Tax=Hymenobacter sp. TaxID=1898978 RepID=UPI002D80459E|nr:putative LPS assembly protein LptD [Hymenobacter sp.]HET9503255.1 putative LPS assembly protein LptD [Hymenobacter sp.]